MTPAPPPPLIDAVKAAFAPSQSDLPPDWRRIADDLMGTLEVIATAAGLQPGLSQCDSVIAYHRGRFDAPPPSIPDAPPFTVTVYLSPDSGDNYTQAHRFTLRRLDDTARLRAALTQSLTACVVSLLKKEIDRANAAEEEARRRRARRVLP